MPRGTAKKKKKGKNKIFNKSNNTHSYREKKNNRNVCLIGLCIISITTINKEQKGLKDLEKDMSIQHPAAFTSQFYKVGE